MSVEKVINHLAKSEGVTVTEWYEDEINNVIIVTAGSKEYLVFSKAANVGQYAINMCKQLHDDVELTEQLKKERRTLTDYFGGKIIRHGVESLISYDQNHKRILSNGYTAYRTV